MKQLQSIFIALFFCAVSHASPTYKDASKSVDPRVDDLLSRMTLEEKLEQINLLVIGVNDNPNNLEQADVRKHSPLTGGFIFFDNDPVWANQLQRNAVENSRLGIPVLLGFDVIHGFRTLFPMPLAQACSWNPELTRLCCRAAAREGYLSGVRWTFSPMIDVARDPRWGRVAESYGEDPYANSLFCVAAVNGYQGEKLSDKYSVAACLKHFTAYAYSQGGRDYHSTDLSDLSLWETALPPYKAGVEAGAATLMSSFNDINGVPATANSFVLNEILKNQWGFKGLVVSDWNAVQQLLNQGFATDSLDAGVKALRGGTDMDMCDGIFVRYLTEALANKKIDMSHIDNAVRRILKIKFELGLFENPYVEVLPDHSRYLADDAVALAQRMAEESMVLLKNENGLLPLHDRRILLVGPMADDRRNMMGTWICNAKEKDVVSVYDGMKSVFGNQVTFLEGFGLESNTPEAIGKATEAAADADVIVIALGERFSWSGENGSKASIALPESQQKIVKSLSRSGKPIVLLLSSGRPLEIASVEPYAVAILQMWQPGLYGGTAVAKILSGEVNPSGRLAITFPLVTGQIPIFYNHRPNARYTTPGQGVYIDCSNEPLYRFGHGLSYTSFDYSEPEVSLGRFTERETIRIKVKVKNSGKMDGYETLFWYVGDPVASITQPVRKLKHVEKRLIKSGHEQEFVFEIVPRRDLTFVDASGIEHLEKGDFYIYAGDKKVKVELI